MFHKGKGEKVSIKKWKTFTHPRNPFDNTSTTHFAGLQETPLFPRGRTYCRTFAG